MKIDLYKFKIIQMQVIDQNRYIKQIKFNSNINNKM